MISSLPVERHRHSYGGLDGRARERLLIVFTVPCLLIRCPSVMLSVSIITAALPPRGGATGNNIRLGFTEFLTLQFNNTVKFACFRSQGLLNGESMTQTSVITER